MIEMLPYLLPILAVIIGGAYGFGRKDGNAKATNAALKKEAAARGEILEMDREDIQAEIAAARLSEKKAREEAMRWAKR